MSLTACVIDVPTAAPASPASLPESLPRRKFAGGSLLEWLAQRLTDVQTVDRILILLGPQQEEFARLCPPGVSVHLSEGADALSRLADVCSAGDLEGIVRVPVDSPFCDPALIDQLVCAGTRSGCDYATYCSHDGRPAVQAQLGMVAEWMTRDAVLTADRSVTDPTLRSHPTRAIWSSPQSFHLKFLSLPEPLDRDDVRLVVANEEDWEHAHQIYDALGPDGLDWQRIAHLLLEQPEMRQRMSAAKDL